MQEGRTDKGTFARGHPDFVKAAGVKTGRPRELKRQVNDALTIAEDAMPRLILDMIADAQDNSASIRDRQMCREYLCDRIYGKANQPLSGKGELILHLLEDKLTEKKETAGT